jgi:hypothetical protein
VSIAGISLPLQIKRITVLAVRQFPLSVKAASLLPLKVTKSVSSGNCGKIISYGFEWAFRYQFFAADGSLNWISHIFWI